MPEANSTTAAKNNIVVALNQAQQYAQAAQWSETISVLQAAIDQCQQYVASEQSTAQSTSSQTLTQQKPEQQNAEAGQTAAILHQAKGDLFANQGDIAAAIASYQKALALAPEADEIKTSLGKTHLAEAALMHRSGNITAATKSYLQALTQSPQLFSAYSRLRYNLLRYDIPRGDPLLKDVVEVCEASLAKHPNIKPAQITLGYALTKLEPTYQKRLTATTASRLHLRLILLKARQPINSAARLILLSSAQKNRAQPHSISI